MKRVKELFKKMNEYGIPLPLVRVNNKPSITATFAVISFITAILGQIGKVTKILGSVDLDAANYLFFGCLFAYLGRRMTTDKSRIDVDKEDNKEEK